MRFAIVLIALAAGATCLVPAASAAGGVYGGTTAGDEAIVFKTDRAGKRVRSAALAWEARCDDGNTYPVSVLVTATRPSPGFEPGPRDLVMKRNRARRFAGSVTIVHSLGQGDHVGVVAAEVAGRLRRTRASGSLLAKAVIFEAETGREVTTCPTGPVRWTASRAAGRVYGGVTDQDAPFVARLDARGRRVQNVYVAWTSQQCSPGGFVRIADGFGGFPVDRRGRWGGAFEHVVPLDAGRAVFAYELRGAFRGAAARGTLSVDLEQVDGAGAVGLSCQTGTIGWSASTG